ncbi:MAG TPA: hypothetical protein VKV25_10960 [Acidimicrobiales bacterium]|nr:hypothetical protein [Acidimicrobiales bacterium]
MVLLQAAPSGAAGVHPGFRTAPGSVLAHGGGTAHAGHIVGTLAHPFSTTGYIYAEDGTYPTDGITVYKVSGHTLSQIQQVTTGEEDGTFYGADHLALTNPGSGDCLIAVNSGDPDSDNGGIESFTVGSNGMLTNVSTLTVAGYADEVVANSSTAYVSTSNSYTTTPALFSYSIGSGCALTASGSISTGSENDVTIGLAANGDVLSADYNSGNWVAYNASLTSEISNSVSTGETVPQGVTVLSEGAHSNVYAGQVSDPAYIEGANFTGTSFHNVSGSPVDSNECNGAATAGSVNYRAVYEANQCSGTITWANVGPSSMSYGGAATLADTSNDPTQMTPVTGNLLVAGAYGELADCALSSAGVGTCRTLLDLPGYGDDYSGSTAVILGTPPR